MNTYAELYGNIKIRLIKNNLVNKLNTAIINFPEKDSMKNLFKAGGAMSMIKDIINNSQASPLQKYGPSELISNKHNSTGMLYCPLQK